MKESYGEGIASHTGPESCVAVREGSGEALTGVGAGRAKEPRKGLIRDADALPECGRPHRIRRYREADSSPARSKTPHMHGNTSHGTREVPCSTRPVMAAWVRGVNPRGARHRCTSTGSRTNP
jgi:hypothetical protein